jgi:hypothetical protein
MIRGTFLAAALVAVALPAYGATPSDAVRFFYDPAHSETDPEFRDRFAGPALEKLNANQSVADDGDLGCIDFALAYDAQDLDDAEVARTLVLEESVSGDTAVVTASFTLFPDEPESAREIKWSLQNFGSDWKITDIASEQNEWRLSAFDCAP